MVSGQWSVVGWGRRDSFWLRWGRLEGLESCFSAGFVETDVLLVETGFWLPQVAADGRWLPRFDKKSRTPNGARRQKKGVTAPRVEA